MTPRSWHLPVGNPGSTALIELSAHFRDTCGLGGILPIQGQKYITMDKTTDHELFEFLCKVGYSSYFHNYRQLVMLTIQAYVGKSKSVSWGILYFTFVCAPVIVWTRINRAWLHTVLQAMSSQLSQEGIRVKYKEVPCSNPIAGECENGDSTIFV